MENKPFLNSARPRIRLFLSADLIGSTALKQNGKNGLYVNDTDSAGSGHWFPQIVSFFSMWGRLFQENWTYCHKNLIEEIQSQKLEDFPVDDLFQGCNCPAPWKAAGDEIIYQVELSSCEHIILALLAWQRTAKLLSKELSQNYRMHAWVASFPVVNSEILIDINAVPASNESNADDPILRNFLLLEDYYKNSEKSSRASTLDFVGPSIDAGFRIGGLSSERKMIISIELAYLLSGILSKKPYKFFQRLLTIYYDGRENLKGMLSGFGYPVFWLDSNPDDTLNIAEDRLLNKRVCSSNDVKDFCAEFIDRVNNCFVVSTPFVYGCRCESCVHQESVNALKPELSRLTNSLLSRWNLDERNNSVAEDCCQSDDVCQESDSVGEKNAMDSNFISVNVQLDKDKPLIVGDLEWADFLTKVAKVIVEKKK